MNRLDILSLILKPEKYIYTKAINCIGNKNDELRNRIINELFNDIKNNKYSIYYGEYPIETSNIDFSSEVSNVGIVIQGKIEYKDDFTITTIETYKKMYPNVKIVVSTWVGEVDDDFRSKCNILNVDIIESDLPENEGFWHVNCQIYNSFIGASYFIDDNDVDYLLKTRSDQRICKPGFIEYMLDLMKLFDESGERIIFLDSSYLYIPFYLCDYLTFGYKRNILNMYDIPFENGECDVFKSDLSKNKEYISKLRLNEKYTLDKFNNEVRKHIDLKRTIVPEVYIAFSYYQKFLNPLAVMEDSKLFEYYWEYICKNCIIVDERDLLLYWPKYNYRKNHDINYSFYGHGLNHMKWLNIYLNYRDR